MSGAPTTLDLSGFQEPFLLDPSGAARSVQPSAVHAGGFSDGGGRARSYEFTEKSGLVTGSGVGLGIVKAFAACGAEVTAADLNETWKEELAKIPSIVRAVKLDASDLDTVFRLVQSMERIDVLGNNAGIYPVCDFFDLTPKDWQRMIGTLSQSNCLIKR